jgi:hypothetical protein
VLYPLALVLGILGQSPDANFRTALADLRTSVPAEKQHVTRYLELTAYPELVRQQAVQVLTGALNSTSFRGTIAQPVVIADKEGHPQLLRIDLESLEWDYGARSIRLRELERRGVNFGFKDDQERNDQLNPWERFVRDEPYHFVTHQVGKHLVRGWIDPAAADEAWRLSKSTNFILRADWLLNRMLTERGFNGGYYSTLLQFSSSERDIYRTFLVDIEAVDRAENKLRVGGAVLRSGGVAHNNRELQLLNSAYGRPVGYIWRTFDVSVDRRGEKSVVEALAGTLKHDGREVIGSLPNGWFWAMLFDAGNNRSDGKAVAVVPDVIATVQEPLTPSRDTRVVNSYACWKCHPSAIREFDDVVRRGIMGPGIDQPSIGFATFADRYNKDQAASIRAAVDDYYNSELGQTIKLHQAMYEATVFKTCGMTGQQYASAMVGLVEGYAKDLVDLPQAAREMGFGVEEARAYLRYARNPKLLDPKGKPVPDSICVLLSAGEPQTRGAWEQAFPNAMRSRLWGWETAVVPVYVTVPAEQPAPLYYQPNGH